MRIRPRTPYIEVAFTLDPDSAKQLAAVTSTIKPSSFIHRTYSRGFTVPIIRAPLTPTAPWEAMSSDLISVIPAAYTQFRVTDVEPFGHSLSLIMQPRDLDATIATVVAEACRGYLIEHLTHPAHHFSDLTTQHERNRVLYGDPDTASTWVPRIPLALCNPRSLVSQNTRSALTRLGPFVRISRVAVIARSPIGEPLAVLHQQPLAVTSPEIANHPEPQEHQQAA